MKKANRRQKRIFIAQLIWLTVNSLPYISLLALVGSFGAYEVDRIGFYQFIVQVILCGALFLFSIHAHYKIYEEVR